MLSLPQTICWEYITDHYAAIWYASKLKAGTKLTCTTDDERYFYSIVLDQLQIQYEIWEQEQLPNIETTHLPNMRKYTLHFQIGKIFTITEKDIYRRIDKLILKQLICLGITPLIVIWWSDFNDNPIMGTISSSMESLFRRSAPNDQIMPQKWIEKRMQMHQKYNGIGDNFSCLKQQLQQKTQRIKYLNVLNEKAKKRPQKQVDKLKEQIEKASYQIQEEDKKQTDMIGKPQMLKIIQITFYKKIKIIGGKFKFLSFLMKF